jgi:NlpC/P60 family putative phage cell wall peptidase
MTRDRTHEWHQRAAVVAEAETWLGTPYHEKARVKGAGGGVDCATLLLEVFSRAGVVANAFPDYAPRWHLHRREEIYLDWIEKYANPIEAGQIEPADLLVWRYGFTFSHGGIYVGNGEVIHSYLNLGCIRSHVNESSLFEGTKGPLDLKHYSLKAWSR